MGIFRLKNSPVLHAAVLIEPHTIQGIIAETKERGSLHTVKKMSLVLARTGDGSVLAKKFHEFVFAVIKGLGRIPDRIVVGLSPSLGEQTLQEWSVQNTEAAGELSRKRLETYFSQVRFQQQRKEAFSFLYPLDILLNGYRMHLDGRWTSLAQTQSVQEIGFRMITLDTAEQMGKNLFEVRKSLGGMPIFFVPVLACYEKAFGDVFPGQDSLVIDIGEDYTALLFLRKKQLVNFAAFTCGNRTFAQAIAKKLGTSVGEAEDLQKQYATAIVEEKVRLRIYDALLEVLKVWQKEFFGHLDAFYANGPLPATVFLCGKGANLPEVVSLLRTTQWLGGHSDTSMPTIRIVGGQTIFQGDTLEGALNGTGDIALGAVLWYSLHHQPILM